jgi:alpha-ketoglutarate-dependent taurine dioxygenase
MTDLAEPAITGVPAPVPPTVVPTLAERDARLAAAADVAGLTVRPLTGYTGAQLGGVDLTRPLVPEAVDAIRAALDRWRVVFFRDQHLDHAQQIAFGRQFGDLTYAHPHDDTPPEGFPEIYTVDPRRFEARNPGQARPRRRQFAYNGGWHTDVTPAVNPPAGSILRAGIVPEYGGDTTFTNLVAVYEGLSDTVRDWVDGLWAEHFYGANWSGGAKPEGPYRARIESNRLVAHHPVVRVHPRTGEKLLFVNPVFTDRILDVSVAESRWILGHLFDELTRPEYQVRFSWEPGSIAFWDNRATAHLGPTDLDHLDVERVLHRVTLIGDVPVGPDGQHSRLVEGVPFRSLPVFQPYAAN